VKPTTDVFEYFRNLKVFVRNKKRFELKVMAVLLYLHGLSLFREELGVLREALTPSLQVEYTRMGEVDGWEAQLRLTGVLHNSRG
jgi:hypothetical protein